MNIFDNIRINERMASDKKFDLIRRQAILNTVDVLKTQLRAALGKAKTQYRVHDILDAISWEGVKYVREISHYLESYAIISSDGKTYHKVYLDINEFKYVCKNKDDYAIDNACVALTKILRDELLKLV